MDPVTERMCAAFREAFPGYLAQVLSSRGVDPAAHVDRLRLAGDALGRELEVFARPFAAQDRSPLEVVRTVTATVVAEIVDLEEPFTGPASSAELGEEAWRAHLAWGAAKADALARQTAVADAPPGPVALLLARRDVRRRLASSLERCGYDVARVRGPEDVRGHVRRPRLALVDLRHGSAFEVIAAAARAGVFVVAVGFAVSDMLEASARAAGARRIVELDRFLDDPCGRLPVVG